MNASASRRHRLVATEVDALRTLAREERDAREMVLAPPTLREEREGAKPPRLESRQPTDDAGERWRSRREGRPGGGAPELPGESDHPEILSAYA